jgi:MoaA/NifB/PqqE/SkfB family radical SAM enzyme
MFIDPRAKTLRHLDRLAGWQVGQKPAPVTVEWDLSNRCSLGCQDCHFAHTHSKGPWTQKSRLLPMAFEGTGDLADMGLVERVCAEMGRSGVRGIVWSGGGEPTLHPEWEDAVMLAAERGLEQGMYTLGGHFTAKTGAFLADIAAWVVVSLDAADADTYAIEKNVPRSRFQAACDGIVHLVGHKAAIGVSFLLHSKNWTKAQDMLALSRMLGATYATFRPAIQFRADAPSKPSGDRAWIHAALPMLESLARQSDVEVDPLRFQQYADWQGHGYTACHGVRLNTTVTPDGRVWLCPQRRGVGAPLGDLRTESFANIWARHPDHYDVDEDCRVMCRLHPVNETLAALATPRAHEAFV